MDPVVWRDGNIILGILNRTIHRPSHECLVDEVEGEGFGADAGRGRVEDDDAVGFELLDLSQPNFNNLSQELLQLHLIAVSKDISLKGWLSVAISSGMETLQYEELKTQYEKTLRSCMIPLNSYLQYTLIRDGGGGGLDENDDLSQLQPMTGWLSVAISSGMETMQYEELKTQYEKTLRSCMIPSNSYLQYTLIRDGGNLEHLLTLSKNSQTLLCKIGTTNTEENLTVRQDLRWNKQVGTLLSEFGLAKQGHRSIGKCSLEKF
ncbi:unnamed protein product [Arabidopsis thaliana]|uniref:(thale cress) hypothetical protein n=1 Tax=Arabidopsis thaliana TaxID=3702 RepID=A0A7G2FHS2_ARATH|nr:unnamed protein product [Arabidopsis thaliana]